MLRIGGTEVAAFPADKVLRGSVQENSMSVLYRVLLVEDCAVDARFNLHALERGGLQVKCERVDTADSMKSALESKDWDFILSDHRLPGFDALEALALYKGKGLDIPFIIVSGQIGEELAVKLVKAGAHD